MEGQQAMMQQLQQMAMQQPGAYAMQGMQQQGMPGMQPQQQDMSQALQTMQGMQGMQQGMPGMPQQQDMQQGMPQMQGMDPAAMAAFQQQYQAMQAQQMAAQQMYLQQLAAAGGGMQAAMPQFAAAGGAVQEQQEPEHEGPTYAGQVVDYSEEKGFGFIECRETNELYGKDMFLLRSCLNGLIVQTGDKVNFKVEKGIKGPKAVDIDITERIADKADSLPTYYGKVKNFDQNRGLGFIDCDETKAVYSKDILVLRSQLGDLGDGFDGTIVSFNIVEDARGVKAANVKICPEGFPPGKEPKPRPGKGKGMVVKGPWYDETAIQAAMSGKGPKGGAFSGKDGKGGGQGKGKGGGKGDKGDKGGKKGGGMDMNAAMMGMMEMMMGGGWDDWGGGGGKGWQPY